MSPTLLLTEWRKSPPLRLTALERSGLETHFDALVTSGPTDDTFVVTPRNTIGTVRIGDTDVVVTPKVPIDRVLFMVAYATDPLKWKDLWSTLSTSQDLVDGLAALFVTTADRVLARGLYRSYRRHQDDGLAVRGRIRWQEQARRQLPLPVALRYDVHDDDVLENQVVRAALATLRRSTVRDHSAASGLARLWRDFRDLTPLSRPEHAVDRVVWNRQNEHYRPLIGLSRIILQGTMAQVDDGIVTVPGFTLSMPTIFEQFVRTALREHSDFTADEFPDNPSVHGLWLDHDKRIRLLPDLAVKVSERWLFLGDVKYKRDEGPGRNADLYQLLAYATAAGLRDATLIYADGPMEAPHHSIRHSDVQLSLVHLDLSQQPSEVLAQLARVPLPRFTAARYAAAARSAS